MLDIPLKDQYVFTSLRYDCAMKKNPQNPICCPESKAAYLIKYHHDRLINSANHMGWYEVAKKYKDPMALFNRVQSAVVEHKRKSGDKCPFKVRVSINHDLKMEVTVQPIFQVKPPLLFPTTLDYTRMPTTDAAQLHRIFKVVLDALPTNRTLFTRDKTHLRTMYNYARQCAQIQSYQDAKEVLLFNSDGEIMDGSITTPYFFRNGKWTTPQNSCGGQQGTTRRWAMDQGLCCQGIIKADSLRHGEVIWLSNGVKGFFTARYIDDQGRCQAPTYRLRPETERKDSGMAMTGDSDDEEDKVPPKPRPREHML